MKLQFIELTTLVSIIIHLTGCGGISIGIGRGILNDSVPNGTVLTQGNFSGQNGQTVTGAAIIYTIGINNYIVRLSGITISFENGLQMWVMANESKPAYIASLKAPTEIKITNFPIVTRVSAKSVFFLL